MLKEFLLEEDGISTVEIVLILLVLITLVVMFKDNIVRFLEGIFNKMNKQSNVI